MRSCGHRHGHPIAGDGARRRPTACGDQHFPNVHAITDLNLITYPNQPIPPIIANFFRKQKIDFKETNKRF